VTAWQPALEFEAARVAAEDGQALVVDLDGYEGPLDVLLALARTQKVDLRALSIARLAEQYLAFVEAARSRRLTLAADYLVMAAWLADLKSRLLLPKPARGEPAQASADALAFRLAKLDAMRGAVEALRARPQLDRDVFARGRADDKATVEEGPPRADLYALVAAYAAQRTRSSRRRYTPAARVEAWPLEAARDRLREALPRLADWTALPSVAPQPDEEGEGEGPSRASYLASTFAAGLELVRDGTLDLSQLAAFEPLYVRARATRAEAA